MLLQYSLANSIPQVLLRVLFTLHFLHLEEPLDLYMLSTQTCANILQDGTLLSSLNRFPEDRNSSKTHHQQVKISSIDRNYFVLLCITFCIYQH